MALIKVPENREAEMLQEFCENSMFTFEGLTIDKNNIKDLEKAVRSAGYSEKDFIAYWFYGSVMNKHYRLTNENAYPDDLTFVVIPNFYNPLFKLAAGARWFDDIVANNSIRQHGIDTGLEPDYE